MGTDRVTCRHTFAREITEYGYVDHYCVRCGIMYMEWADDRIHELEQELQKTKTPRTKRTESTKPTPTNDDTPADQRARTLRVRYVHPTAQHALATAGGLIEYVGDTTQRVLLPHESQFRGNGIIYLPTLDVLFLIPDPSREYDGNMLGYHPQLSRLAQINHVKISADK